MTPPRWWTISATLFSEDLWMSVGFRHCHRIIRPTRCQRDVAGFFEELARHRSQQLGSAQSPWMRTTGTRDDTFARSTCSTSCSLILVSSVGATCIPLSLVSIPSSQTCRHSTTRPNGPRSRRRPVNASSRIARPSLASASVTVQGGTTCSRLKLVNGSRPRYLQASRRARSSPATCRRRARAARASRGR